MPVLLIAGRPFTRTRSAALLKRVKHQLAQPGLLIERLHIRDLSPRTLLVADIGHSFKASPYQLIVKNDGVTYARTRLRSFDEIAASAMLHCPD